MKKNKKNDFPGMGEWLWEFLYYEDGYWIIVAILAFFAVMIIFAHFGNK